MWKKWMTIVFISVFAFTVVACGSNGRTNDRSAGQGTGQTEGGTSGLKNDREETGDEISAEILPEENEGSTGIQPEKDDGSHILIAYFSRVGNTDFPEGVDAISSASLIQKDGEIYGNTQYVASLIGQHTGGEMFLIETEEKYPADYDETDEQGGRENRERTRPKLASHIQNLDDYDTIFLGFPNWYYDMPMAVYAFLEEYDLSGKRIIPFVTSGGSGFSDSISEIKKLQPGAEVEDDGFKATHSKIDDVTAEDVGDWIADLNL